MTLEEKMKRNGELPLKSQWLRVAETQKHAGTLDVVVPFTTPEITAKVVKRAAEFASGLNASLKLIAVWVIPYPAELRFPTATQDHLTNQLSGLARQSELPVTIELVAARGRDEGYCCALPQASTVLLGIRKHWWRTREERLARALAHQGHCVSLVHFD